METAKQDLLKVYDLLMEAKCTEFSASVGTCSYWYYLFHISVLAELLICIFESSFQPFPQLLVCYCSKRILLFALRKKNLYLHDIHYFFLPAQESMRVPISHHFISKFLGFIFKVFPHYFANSPFIWTFMISKC